MFHRTKKRNPSVHLGHNTVRTHCGEEFSEEVPLRQWKSLVSA